jgi:LysR family glycine cleavage system transcriptional activator
MLWMSLVHGKEWRMVTRLPPLNALRTFEAAARHLSFTRAADELFVTQAAVSHQIRALEEHLGAPLFRRMNRALMLTDQGQVLLPAVRDAFDRLQAGVRRVEDLSSGGALTISTTPSFAASWLAGRLVRFQVLHPEIELQLSATSRLVDFAREGIDCGIRYGAGDWPGLVSQRLFETALLPVCSPTLLDGVHPLRRPADLAQHTLLHALDGIDDWRLWLRAAGVPEIDPTRGPKFDSIPLVLQAAVNGAGVGIGRRQLLEAEIAAGRLIAPFDLELPDAYAYYFIAPEATADQPKLTAFRDWLLAEVASANND